MTAYPHAWPHRFADLGPAIHTQLHPTPLPASYWASQRPTLALEPGLGPAWLPADEVLQTVTGYWLLPGIRPLASVHGGPPLGH